MAFEKWFASRQKKQLEKVNNELEDLKRKGLDYEIESGKRKTLGDGRKRVSGSSGGNIKERIISVVVLLILVWFFTRFYYVGDLKEISGEKEGLQERLEEVEKELGEVSGEVELLEENIGEKEDSEYELAEKYGDLNELAEILQEKVDALTDEKNGLIVNVSDLQNNLTEQTNLANFYANCITDDSYLDQNMSVCGNLP
tara:strand:+ start:32 stop:628 length:597 start_codon:yes stop_codon:yes gene_type:complete